MATLRAAGEMKGGPDLLAPPHLLADLMELFGGDGQQALSQHEHVLAHLAQCHFCRTALMVLLSVAQDYDRGNNNPEEPTRALLTRFARISREIEAREAREAREFERLGAYAEAVVAEGWERTAQRFPDIASHLTLCPDCRSAIEETVAFINESEESD